MLRGAGLKLTCAAACTERALLTVDRKTAKRLRLKGKRRGGRVVVGSGRATLTRAGTTTLVVRLARANAARLRKLRPRRLRLAVALDGGDSSSTLTVRR
jgi:hypothetical protein